MIGLVYYVAPLQQVSSFLSQNLEPTNLAKLLALLVITSNCFELHVELGCQIFSHGQCVFVRVLAGRRSNIPQVRRPVV